MKCFFWDHERTWSVLLKSSIELNKKGDFQRCHWDLERYSAYWQVKTPQSEPLSWRGMPFTCKGKKTWNKINFHFSFTEWKDGVGWYQRLKQYSHQVAVKHLCVKTLACNGYFFLVEKKKLRFPDSNAVTEKNWKFTFLGLVLLVQVVVQLGKALAVVSTHAERMEGMEYAPFENNLLLWLGHQSKDQNHLS